ncbi:MAG TPA: hypothetical protein VG452_00305 [Egibacteraceae bacterium]|nr:hypothetical protein [Egibacteraceae bacterium]
MRGFLTYGPGIPRYVALWLPLTPLLVAALLALRVRRGAVAVVVASTLPTFLLHNPPGRLPFPVRWALLTALLGGLAWWVAARVRGGGPVDGPRPPVRWPLVLALGVVALLVRVPLAWVDPGVGDFARSSETAARQLLAGANPYTVPNEHTVYGIYQYPAGSLLAHLPFVAVAPRRLLAEPWVGARAALWATEAAAVALLAWAGARLGHARAGVAAAVAYALGPTLVRESAIVVANDLMLALAGTASAVALAAGRPLAAGLLAGLAVSVKPPALLLVPLLLVAAGWRPAALACAVPAVLQAPFLLWPSPGLHGLVAIAEPAARPDPYATVQYSTWWPLYATLGPTRPLLGVVTAAGVVAACAAAVWAGRQLRRRGITLARTAAAYALPLLVAFLGASALRTNFQDWYLPLFLLCAAVVGTTPGPAAPRHARAVAAAGVRRG